MDNESPDHRLLEIKYEITRCLDELTELTQIIEEVEGEHGRFSLDHLTPQEDDHTQPIGRPDQADQAVAHYNRLMTKLNTLNSRAISHPVHWLPEELLEHIFHMLLEIESADGNYVTAAYEAFPLNLTRVCRQWESTVMSVRNRRLWTTIRVDPADPDWLGQLHLFLFLSRDETLNIQVTEMTQDIVDELAGCYRRIRSFLPGLTTSQIWGSSTSDPDTVELVISDTNGKKPFTVRLSSTLTTLPFIYLKGGSLHPLQSLFQLHELLINTTPIQWDYLGGPLLLPALQRLHLLLLQKNPLDFLRIFAPSQLLDLQLVLPEPLSSAAYLELEAFIMGHMPNLRWVILEVYGYVVDPESAQPVEGSTTQPQPPSAMQSESIRRIECSTHSRRTGVPPPLRATH